MSDDRKPPTNNPQTPKDNPQRPEDENPFIAFRRFADERVTSILNTLGLPSSWNPQHWDEQRIQELKAWITEGKTPSGNEDAASTAPQDQPSWLKIWSPDVREVKPKIVENEDGSKTYYWSKSWSWPPKDDSEADESNDLDARQRQAIEEGRRKAEKDLQELSNMLKSIFGPEEGKDNQNEPKGGSVLDWVRPSQPKSSPDKGMEISKEIESPEQESQSRRERFWSRCRPHSEDAPGHGHHGFPPFMHFHGPRFGQHRFGDCRMRWLLSHPYSPVVLESENAKANVHGPNFVDAFEDLLRVEQGLPIDERWAWERDMWPRRMRLMSLLHSPHPKTQEFWTNMHEGGEWHVARRGFKPLQAAMSLPAPDTAKDEKAVESNSEEHDQAYERFLGTSSTAPKTELDAYEQFLGSGSDSNSSAQPQPRAQQQKAAPSKSEKPAPEVVQASPILSTVTSTERTVLPDGTVTTRIVLRKRFADGREESSETVRTKRGDAVSATPEPAAAADGKSSGGWFWSK